MRTIKRHLLPPGHSHKGVYSLGGEPDIKRLRADTCHRLLRAAVEAVITEAIDATFLGRERLTMARLSREVCTSRHRMGVQSARLRTPATVAAWTLMPRYTMVEVALELGDHALNSDLLAAQPTLARFWTVLTRGYWCVAHSGMRWAAVCISAPLQPWLHDFPADHGIDITSVPRFAPSSNGYIHRNAVAPAC